MNRKIPSGVRMAGVKMKEPKIKGPKKFFGMGFLAGVGVGVAAVVVGLIAIFIFAIIGALMGAITGWIIQITPWLGDAVKAGFTALFDIESPDLVTIGAAVGFIAGFFKNWGGGHNHHDECCEWD